MARNKHPEDTVARILDVSVELFMERGYDHTTMQDIVDNLGGLTKGAVYHHFKSKEEIFEAAVDRMLEPSVRQLERIMADRSLTGLEKVQRLYDEPANGMQTELFRRSEPSCDPIKNARLLGMEFRDVFAVSAHRFLEPAIVQGAADGTIQTDYPRELAEVVSLLGNLWCTPLFYPGTPEELQRRAEFLQLLVHRMGLAVNFTDPARHVREACDTCDAGEVSQQESCSGDADGLGCAERERAGSGQVDPEQGGCGRVEPGQADPEQGESEKVERGHAAPESIEGR